MRLYSPFPGRWDSKYSSECKNKILIAIEKLPFRSLFLFSNEKRLRKIVLWFRLGFRFAFQWLFRVSSSKERAVPPCTYLDVRSLIYIMRLKHPAHIWMCHHCIISRDRNLRSLNDFTQQQLWGVKVTRCLHMFSKCYSCVDVCSWCQCSQECVIIASLWCVWNQPMNFSEINPWNQPMNYWSLHKPDIIQLLPWPLQ